MVVSCCAMSNAWAARRSGECRTAEKGNQLTPPHLLPMPGTRYLISVRCGLGPCGTRYPRRRVTPVRSAFVPQSGHADRNTKRPLFEGRADAVFYEYTP